MAWTNEDTSDVIVFPIAVYCVTQLDYALPISDNMWPMLGILLLSVTSATVIILTLNTIFPNRKP